MQPSPSQMGWISGSAGDGFVEELATGMHLSFEAEDRLVTKNYLSGMGRSGDCVKLIQKSVTFLKRNRLLPGPAEISIAPSLCHGIPTHASPKPPLRRWDVSSHPQGAAISDHRRQ